MRLPLAFLLCLIVGAGIVFVATKNAQSTIAGATQETAGPQTAGTEVRARLSHEEDDLGDAEDEAIVRIAIHSEAMTAEQAVELLAAANRRLDRREVALERAKRLVDEGLATPATLDNLVEEVEVARRERGIAYQRAKSVREIVARTYTSRLFRARWMTSTRLAFARSPGSVCNPVDQSLLSGAIYAAATAHQLDPALLRAVIRQESAFRPCAVSVKGAMGLMQLMPETAQQFHLADPFDPELNIRVGAQYMRYLLDLFKGDLTLALAAYNAGPKRVREGGAALEIPETRNYVRQVLEALATAVPGAADRSR